MRDLFTVFVGGCEVTNNYVSESMAENIATDYACDGYDDVVVVEMDNQLTNVVSEKKM